MATMQQIAAHAQKLMPEGVTVELVKGEGYLYFTAERAGAGGLCDFYETNSVYCYAFNRLTAAQWRERAEAWARTVAGKLAEREEARS